MIEILIFIGVMAIILLGLFIFIMSKVGFSYSALKDYIKQIENKTVLQASAGITGAMLVVAFIVFMIGQAVHAEGKWLDTASVFVGIDYHQDGSVFCKDPGVSDKLNSNLGATIEVYRYGNHSLSGNYTHHSCAINPDVNTYDGIGFKYEWKIY
jgi:hypothetical protein